VEWFVIPITEARQFIFSKCGPLAPTSVEVTRASRHVLAETIQAVEPVPAFDNSAMDGYAVRAADTCDAPAHLQVLGSLMAGNGQHMFVSSGQTVRIMTGAPLPSGADAICIVEDVQLEAGGSIVVIEKPVAPGTYVRRTGDDICPGDEVFTPGEYLGPAHIGVLSSLGVKSVRVHPAPKVGVLSTGDELTQVSGPLPRGKIHDANRPSLLARLRSDGFDVLDLGIVVDDRDELASCIEDAMSACDAIVTSGGVSVGDRDLVSAAFEDLCGSTMRSMQVAVKPGKPLAFGVIESSNAPLFGLPGNPVSALVSYELFVRPSLRSMAGYRVLDRPRLMARADADFSRPRDGKVHFIRSIARTGSDGVLRVRPCGGSGSHLLRSLAYANALAVSPDGEGAQTGDAIEVLVLDFEQLVVSREALS
jgi:molybdopterin molybdotransferase